MDPKRLISITEAFPTARVAVIGDCMLDRYTWGTAARISQEAPVPVVRAERMTVSPGGAANAMRTLACLGAETLAFGPVGDDAAGEELRTVLEDIGVDTAGLVTVKGRRTSEKTRILAGAQQVVRVDMEDTEPIGAETEQGLLERLRAALANDGIAAIIVQDYAKGAVSQNLLRQTVRIASDEGIPVALDPHAANAFNVPGLFLMTPNRAEAFALAGRHFTDARLPLPEDAALRQTVEALEGAWKVKNLLVTLGPAGMALFRAGEAPVHFPTQAREVFDVSGAGDTVIAVCVLAAACGANIEEAAILANHAAGVVVGKVGTAPIYPHELLASFETPDP